MPQLSADEKHRLIRECLEAEAANVLLPDDVEGSFRASFEYAGTSHAFSLAVRTITRDTRHAGEWVRRLKIQATGLTGVQHLDGLLGVNVFGGEPVFVAIDVGRHVPVRGTSTNIQFPEQLVLEARDIGRVVQHTKDNGEVVSAFPGVLLPQYLLGQLPHAALSGEQPGPQPVVGRVKAREFGPEAGQRFFGFAGAFARSSA